MNCDNFYDQDNKYPYRISGKYNGRCERMMFSKLKLLEQIIPQAKIVRRSLVDLQHKKPVAENFIQH